MPSFKADDVWKVAKAMLDTSVDQDTRGDGRNECHHCRGSNYWKDSPDAILHDANCPVLVARDLLTGAPAEIKAA